MSHECRSSLSKEIISPFSRFNDRGITVASLRRTGKLGMLRFFLKLPNGQQVSLKDFQSHQTTEVVICPETKSYFNIDGEIYENDTAYVKVVPSYLNLIGYIYDHQQDIMKFR